MQHTILVVDDDSNVLQDIVTILTRSESKYSILMAPNGKVACEIATEKIPNLILMDWVMPEMSGIEAIKKLKSEEKTKHIPVLMVTSQTSSAELQEGLEVGAMDYIRKPIDRIELAARVKNALDLFDSYKEVKEQKAKVEEKNKKLWDVNLLVNTEKERLVDQNLEIIQWLRETEVKNKKLWSAGMKMYKEKETTSDIAAELKQKNKELVDMASKMSEKYKASIEQLIANHQELVDSLLKHTQEK
ncbi:response regulator [bacterium AH-315-C07]|nr:response regulator [bacterium AH-315-C07]